VSARDWVRGGTDLFLTQLAAMADNDLNGPTDLPGWSRRHVVAHVHFNARALLRLVSWAVTGVETRMYASLGQRAAEIEEGAAWQAGTLRSAVLESADELEMALDGLAPDTWRNEVVTAQGRTVPVSEVPWMRAREVMIHTVDLRTGVTFDDLPGDFTSVLLADVVRKRSAAGQGPALAAWLTGRSEPPSLGPWL
jgi:maleylpyruvate isomerase